MYSTETTLLQTDIRYIIRIYVIHVYKRVEEKLTLTNITDCRYYSLFFRVLFSRRPAPLLLLPASCTAGLALGRGGVSSCRSGIKAPRPRRPGSFAVHRGPGGARLCFAPRRAASRAPTCHASSPTATQAGPRQPARARRGRTFAAARGRRVRRACHSPGASCLVDSVTHLRKVYVRLCYEL